MYWRDPERGASTRGRAAAERNARVREDAVLSLILYYLAAGGEVGSVAAGERRDETSK
jgi:hypothetical protein